LWSRTCTAAILCAAGFLGGVILFGGAPAGAEATAAMPNHPAREDLKMAQTIPCAVPTRRPYDPECLSPPDDVYARPQDTSRAS
jgi:hypothetical protein